MKKLLVTLAIAGIASIQVAQADTIAGIEVGGYQWKPDYKGSFSATDGGLEGTNINIQDDLGFSKENHNIIWASLEHPIPFLPNVKIVSSDLDASATSAENVNFTFNGTPYAAEKVSTKFDLSNTEYTFYYELLDNWISIDAGLTLRQYDGMIEMTGETSNNSVSEDLDFTIPLLYIAARADLPFTGFFVDGQLNIISAGGNSLSDTNIGVGYESDIGLGAKAGYRTFNMEVDEDGFVSDLEFSGAYVSVFYHF